MSSIKTWTGTGIAVVALAAGGLVPAVGAFASTGSSGSSASGTPECKASDVTATYKATDAAMSHRYGRIKLKNVSDSACWIKGYGGLSYVGDDNGTQIGAPAERTPSSAPRTVLQPGDKVRSGISEAVAEVYPKSTCDPRHVDGFRVYIPDETHSIYIKHPTTGCDNSSVSLLEHKAYH